MFFSGGWRGFPGSKKRFEFRLRFGQSEVADDDECGAVRMKPGLVELDQIGALQLGDAFDGSGTGVGNAIGMIRNRRGAAAGVGG